MPTYRPGPELSPSPSGLVTMEMAPASRSPQDGGADSDLGSLRTMRPPGSVPPVRPGAQHYPMGPEGYQSPYKPPVTHSPGPVLVLRPVANGSDESLKCSQGQRDPCVSLQPQSLGWAPSGSSVSPNKHRGQRPRRPWLGAVGTSGESGQRTWPTPRLWPLTLGELRTGGCSYSPAL